MMKKNAMYIVVVSSLMILFCLVYQGTYSYFATGYKDSRKEKNTSITTADLQDLTMVSGNTNGSDLLIPGESVTSTFTVTNPSSMKICFKLNWYDVDNTFVNTNDLKVVLTDSANNNLGNGVFPTLDSMFLDGIAINANTTETYTVTVTYENTEENQFRDMGKTFKAKLNGELTVCPAP